MMFISDSEETPALATAIERACSILDEHDRDEVASLVAVLARNRRADADTLTLQAVTTLSPQFNIRRAVARQRSTTCE